MVAPSLQGNDPGNDPVPAPSGPPALVTLVLEAVVGVLQRVPVARPGLVRLQTGAQALQVGDRPLTINTAVHVHLLCGFQMIDIHQSLTGGRLTSELRHLCFLHHRMNKGFES